MTGQRAYMTGETGAYTCSPLRLRVQQVEMATGDSYHRLVTEYRKRDNYGAVFRSTLDQLRADVDLSWATSCAAFGTGSGEREMEFVQCLLPNLRTFTAVEPDRESLKALRARFQDGELPGVEPMIIEATAENCKELDSPVDIVLLFSVIPHVHPADRQTLFNRLFTRFLNPGGMVVIVDNNCLVPSGFLLLMERVRKPRDDYSEMEKDMVAAGFRILLTRNLDITRDLSNPSDDVVKFIQLLSDYKFTETEVRCAIDEVFSLPNMGRISKKLAIFVKDA